MHLSQNLRRRIAMDLPTAQSLLTASSNNPQRSLLLSAAGATLLAPEDGERTAHRTNGTAHFADILGQTLAGPLFATWTPTPEIIGANKPAANQAQVASLDPNGRRDGRK